MPGVRQGTIIRRLVLDAAFAVLIATFVES
jgi:hypothetical protein